MVGLDVRAFPDWDVAASSASRHTSVGRSTSTFHPLCLYTAHISLHFQRWRSRIDPLPFFFQCRLHVYVSNAPSEPAATRHLTFAELPPQLLRTENMEPTNTGQISDSQVESFIPFLTDVAPTFKAVRNTLLRRSPTFAALKYVEGRSIVQQVVARLHSRKRDRLKAAVAQKQNARADGPSSGPVLRLRGGEVYHVDPKDEERSQLGHQEVGSAAEGEWPGELTPEDVQWDTHHAYDHPVPFVGCPCSWNVSAGWYGLYRDIGRNVNKPHPGHPEEGERAPSLQQPAFSRERSDYMRLFARLDHGWDDVPELPVQEVSKRLYDLNIGPAFYHETILNCLSVVAQGFLESSPLLRIAMPVMAEFGLDWAFSMVPLNTAILLQSTDGRVKIVPCVFRLMGSWDAGIPYTRYVGDGWQKNKVFHGWTYGENYPPGRNQDAYEEMVRRVRQKFLSVPCLSIRDAVMIGVRKPGSPGWSPRRYADVWKVCWNSSPSSSAYEPLKRRREMETNHSELFSSVSKLVDRLFDVAADFRLLFTNLATLRPFQVIRVDDFELSLPRILPPLLRDTVDGQPRCRMFDDCNVPRLPGSSYCMYHSKRSRQRRGENGISYHVEYVQRNGADAGRDVKAESDSHAAGDNVGR
ncbi:hypothetical protein BC567DRAFT_249391 [Phyllosticta citribraziliensis]